MFSGAEIDRIIDEFSQQPIPVQGIRRIAVAAESKCEGEDLKIFAEVLLCSIIAPDCFKNLNEEIRTLFLQCTNRRLQVMS